MDRKTLLEQKARYRAAAELAVEESSKAMASDDMTTANTKSAEADGYIAKAENVQAQIDRLDKMDALKDKEPEKAETATKTNRLPFDDADAPEPEEEMSVSKAVYVMQFGEAGKAVDVVTKDVFGKDYNVNRQAQKAAFSKYLRYGNSRLTAKDADLLNELIYTPEVVEAEVKAGFTVQEIKSNKTVQQEAALELGGALVPEDWRAEVLKRMMGMTIMRGRARIVTTVRDAIEWPRLEGGDERYTSGVRVTWVDEVPDSATVAQTNFTLGTVKVPVHTVMARTDVSRNLLEDAGVSVSDLVGELFAEAMAIDEDEQFLVGNGAGRPFGLLGNRSGAEYTPADGIPTVISGSAAALTADGLINLVYDLDPQYLTNAIWAGNKTGFRDIRKLKDGNGDYLWARGIERGAPPIVLGYDYLMSQALPAVAANAYPFIFGDMRGYLIADRVGMTVQRVEDTDTVGKNKVAIFARRRLGGQVIMPWMFRALKVSA